MPAAFSIRVLDSIIRIEIAGTMGPPSVPVLREPWQALLADPALPADATVQVVVGSPDAPETPGANRIIRTAGVAEAAEALTTAVTVEGIARLRGRALLFHAAGVAQDDGGVIGFVGPSGRGKTTAARALAQSYGYVTDETLAVLPDLSVIPYPKPLSVLDGPPPKHAIPPHRFGMRSAPDRGLRLSALALLDRRPGVGAPRVELVDLAEAVGLITPETSALVALPRPLGDLVDALVRTGGLRRIVYEEASQLPSMVPEVLAAVSESPPTEAIRPARRDDAPPDSPRGGYRREPWADAVRVGERTVVHDGARVFVLDGLGPLLWDHVDGAELDELVALTTRFAPPPPGIDPAAEVRRQLETMTDAGILRRG